ncbi:MAG: tetratricopeptide repeat protein [Chlamydiota bacterium]
MMNKYWLLPLLFFTSCVHVQDTIAPELSLAVDKNHIQNLASAFTPLSEEEKQEDWAKEYLIGLRFAQNLDLYRAISTFKRSEVLADRYPERLRELSYFMIYCYYLGDRYQDAVTSFERSDLLNVDLSFPPHHDLLLVLLKSYMQVGHKERSEKIHQLLQKNYPETYQDVQISLALQTGNLPALATFSKEKPYLNSLLKNFDTKKKSVAKAQCYNALLPGAGYFYLGQHKTAMTTFLFNTLFIYTSCHFFLDGNIAAGILSSFFEFGWYLGSIYGAGESAKYYNERLYEKSACKLAEEHRHTPTFMLRYGF